jgi:CRISPR/Cas system endoribonuclease Cas6 (RAMP superfamily)
MFKTNFLPENPSYPQEFKFPDTVNNNLKIKYHYLDTTFTDGASSFVATMNAEGSNLQKNYKNVKSIELISAMLLKADVAEANEEIIYMHIDELKGVIDSNIAGGQNAFAKLVFDTAGTNFTTFAFAQINCGMNSLLEYETKGKRLDKMTIRFKNRANAIIETTGTVSLTFRIGVIEPIIPA